MKRRTGIKLKLKKFEKDNFRADLLPKHCQYVTTFIQSISFWRWSETGLLWVTMCKMGLLTTYFEIQRGVCMQTILTREPLIFVFQGFSGIRKMWVPARNVLDIFWLAIFFLTFSTFLFYIGYTNFQTSSQSIWLSHSNGCRMTRGFWRTIPL